MTNHWRLALQHIYSSMGREVTHGNFRARRVIVQNTEAIPIDSGEALSRLHYLRMAIACVSRLYLAIPGLNQVAQREFQDFPL